MSRGFHSEFVDNSRTFSGMTSSVLSMRWDNLFDDLEGQLEAEIDMAEQSVHSDEERQRQAHLTLQERLRNLTPALQAAVVNGAEEPEGEADAINLTLTSGRDVTVAIMSHGMGWCAVDIVSPAGLEGHAILPIAAIAALNLTSRQMTISVGVSVAGLPSTPSSLPPQAPRVADAIGLGFVLRDLAQRRKTIEIHSLQGIFVGTLDRVGADHCDFAEHSPSGARRNESIRSYRVFSLANITLVRIL